MRVSPSRALLSHSHDTMQRTLASSARAFSRVSANGLARHARPCPAFSLPRLAASTPLARRAFASSSAARNSSSPSAATSSPASSEDHTTHALPAPSGSTPPPSDVLKLEPRKAITFTCAADDCTTRQTHEFTKRSYERGIVIVQCPGCKNRCAGSRHFRLCSLFTRAQTPHRGQPRLVQGRHRRRRATDDRGHHARAGRRGQEGQRRRRRARHRVHAGVSVALAAGRRGFRSRLHMLAI
jgi:hypothetical protein